VLAAGMVAGEAGASDFGVLGLIDVPTARMREEGELGLSYATQEVAGVYSISYQPTPWAETAFRYTIFNPYRKDGSSDELKDRSFEGKFRLLTEDPTGWRPAVAVGIRDLLGTGVWSSEYLVASKRIGRLDATIGLGWGRFADRDLARNPLSLLHDSFERRDGGFDPDTDQGGEFAFDNYFSGGRIGLLGGLRYSLPKYHVDLVAEYNPDAYRREITRGTLDDTDPWSFAVEWEPATDVRLSASWQQGNQFSFRISTALGTATDTPRKPPNGFGSRSRASAPSRNLSSRTNWYRRMTLDAQDSGVLVRKAERIDEETLAVEYSNRAYQYEADAVNRILTLAEVYAPRDVRRVIVTGREAEVLTHSVDYRRRGQAEWSSEVELPETARDATILPPQEIDEADHETEYSYPNGVFSYNVSARTYLFDPDDPFRYQLFARLNGDFDLGRGFGFTASWVQNIYDQFGEIDRQTDSQLPRVRSNVVRYLQEGTSGIDRAVLTKRGSLADDLHFIAYAGILEEMYSGAGGEVLFRPFGSRFAVGASAAFVQQREFDRGLGLRDYETITGHVSGYWASPFWDLDVTVHAGRYLARDWGATLEVQKRFANGWSVGAFATLTDVPFDVFGEGSFDKGLFFRIPFDPFVGFNTRGAYRLLIRPVQRDGGQRLESWGTTLWETLRSSHYDHLSDHRARMIP
jgi:hypothetical protein